MGMRVRTLFISILAACTVIAETIDSTLVGTYGAILPAADAPGRVVTLQLLPNGEATLTTQFIGSDSSLIEIGKWTANGNSAVVQLTEVNGKKESSQITWSLQGNDLKTTQYDTGQYGSAGLPLHRSSTGQMVKAQFSGVNFEVDSWLAKTVEGDSIPATPVEDAPELGGGAPAHIRFTFNGQKPSEGIDPYEPQILIFPLKEIKNLHPSVAQEVSSLQQLLEDKPDSPSGDIPVFPLFSAAQVFHCHLKYFFFKNGGGVRFLTYYQQDAAPIQRDRIFYAFQGLTSDDHWYISAFWPIMTDALPTANQQMNAAQYDAFGKQFDSYLSGVLSTLEGTASGGYVPDLAVIDHMLQTLNVSPQKTKS
jgi:NlpE N-terminal domain